MDKDRQSGLRQILKKRDNQNVSVRVDFVQTKQSCETNGQAGGWKNN